MHKDPPRVHRVIRLEADELHLTRMEMSPEALAKWEGKGE